MSAHAVDDRAEEARLAFGQPPSRRLLLEIGSNRRDRFLDPRRVDIGDHERHLEPAQEQRRELRRHQPGADDADLLDPPRLRVGNPDALLDLPLDEVERVDRGLRLRAGQQVAECLLLRCVPLLDRPAGAAGNQVERAIRGERDTVHRVVDGVPRLGADLGCVGEVGGRAWSPSLLDRAYEPLDRVVEELDVVEKLVDEPELCRLGGAQEPVLLQSVGDDQLHRRGRADDPRYELGAAPGRDDPEEDLREADVAHGAGQRPEVTVERDLEAAPEGGAVDRGERREGQVANRPEGIVPSLRGGAGELRRRHLRELRQVGAGSEDERLARENEPAPASALEPRHELAERLERSAAEDVRLLPVLAVVHRHERERADAGRHFLEEELRRALSHTAVFSHNNAAPIPRPMQRAVIP